MNKILLIGCGHMGSALLNAWIKKTSSAFIVIDFFQNKKINKIFKKRLRDFDAIKKIKNLKSIDIVVFAIKPQMAKSVLEDFISLTFGKRTVFVSIVAGKKINFFSKFLSNSVQFIRVMPNMPAIVNEGMTCLVANKNVSIKNKNLINKLFLNIGKNLWLKNESEINKVTAISGSGPGYIFLFIDAFEKASKQLNLGNKITKKLIHQTFLGSVKLLLKEKQTAAVLVKNIAVKGGTTEAGLNKFKDKKVLHTTFKKVIMAAYRRANKLGK